MSFKTKICSLRAKLMGQKYSDAVFSGIIVLIFLSMAYYVENLYNIMLFVYKWLGVNR